MADSETEVVVTTRRFEGWWGCFFWKIPDDAGNPDGMVDGFLVKKFFLF